ncbi:DUF421 domain-containing protein [Halorubellus sp. JP-L1]|uniref:DUF421 domain-containing protein n=1 Tax=Halorubellus sp. JP-L1 TaxID=2715753 RepID=UPI00140770F9|nr:YetF domain-containing protein [Halorubellus sp. JP-L1]NHN43456.1 DUF421 domain-containing protein [Halorubellus sp. JP-L1]
MSDVAFFFEGWEPIVRIVVVGVPMYVALTVFLRLSGSRALANLHVFDFIVTVAIGSAFGRALTATDVTLAEAVAAFLLLISLQYVVTVIQARSPRFGRVITNQPALLYYQECFLQRQMRANHVTRDELLTAVREHQMGSIDDVDAIVLESTGEVSVVRSLGDESALEGLVQNASGASRGDGG